MPKRLSKGSDHVAIEGFGVVGGVGLEAVGFTGVATGAAVWAKTELDKSTMMHTRAGFVSIGFLTVERLADSI